MKNFEIETTEEIKLTRRWRKIPITAGMFEMSDDCEIRRVGSTHTLSHDRKHAGGRHGYGRKCAIALPGRAKVDMSFISLWDITWGDKYKPEYWKYYPDRTYHFEMSNFGRVRREIGYGNFIEVNNHTGTFQIWANNRNKSFWYWSVYQLLFDDKYEKHREAIEAIKKSRNGAKTDFISAIAAAVNSIDNEQTNNKYGAESLFKQIMTSVLFGGDEL